MKNPSLEILVVGLRQTALEVNTLSTDNPPYSSTARGSNMSSARVLDIIKPPQKEAAEKQIL